MHLVPDDDQWKTADMVEAERVLAERSATVDDAIARARSIRVEIKPITEAEVASLDAAARVAEAPGLRELAGKVDSGQLTWRDIFDGHGIRDREVRAALAEFGRHFDDGGVLGAISRAYQAGHSTEEIERAIQDSVRPAPAPDGYLWEQPLRRAAPVELESFEEITYRL